MNGPEFQLHYYAWEKGKAIASISSAPVGFNGNIRQISINPFDATEICVIGDKIFKIFRYSEGLLRSIRTSCPNKDFYNHIWLQNNAIALGSSDGKIYIVLDGNLIQELNFATNVAVDCLANFDNGFAAAGAHGTIVLYSRVFQDVRADGYEIKRKIQFPDQELHIKTMSISPSYRDIIISSDQNQIFKISLEETDLAKKVVAKLKILGK